MPLRMNPEQLLIDLRGWAEAAEFEEVTSRYLGTPAELAEIKASVVAAVDRTCTI